MKYSTESNFKARIELFRETIKTTLRIALLFSGLFGLSIPADAQDILKLKSGTEIRVTIIEETTGIVRYREFENPNGPVYSIGKDKVESIQYKKGTRQTQIEKAKEAEKAQPAVQVPAGQSAGPGELSYKKRTMYLDGVPKGPREINTLMEDQPEALMHFEKGRKMLSLSTSCAVGIVLTSAIAGLTANKQTDESRQQAITATGLAIDGAFIIAAIILSSGGKKNIRKSVTLYNSSLNRPVTLNFDFGVQENGIGLGLRF